ncbi:MAG TPA: LLM class F420-dependent oxidoreductase [Tepidiformaceae bacterium]|nr:LLM class F420-dependent oxidoreductase [Tepidiformaceae bacterium]
MKYGVQMFPTDYAIPVTELGKACEDLGFESLFFPEHTHIPTSRRTPWPGGAELPKEYSHTLDPFVACGAVAGVTKNLKMGTGICLVMQRDPITLAKEVASVDFLSGGRFLFGIGGGWNEDEMENHGTKPTLRWKILRERILAMKEIWTNDEAEFHGQFVNFDPIWSWPKPAAKPHPPILIGGAGPRTLERVIEYGDGWMPIGGRSGAILGEKIKELQQMAKDAGRGEIPVSVFGVPPSKEALENYAAMGVDRAIFGLRPEGAENVIPALKRYAEAAGL